MKLLLGHKEKAIKEKDYEINVVTNIEQESIELLETLESAKNEAEECYERMSNEKEFDFEMQSMAESYKRASHNITKVFKQMYFISDEFNTRVKDWKRQCKKRRFIKTAPANAYIDKTEMMMKHFAQGLNIYKLALIFFFASFFGVIVETLWALVMSGKLVSRASLVYGPFNLLYGMGGVLLTVFLYKYRNRGDWLSFLGGMFIGSVLEYSWTLVQEMVFGTRSWDYSDLPFNVDGRICLLYSVAWGFLGVLWMKNIYPRMAKIVLKIPNEFGKIITVILTLFLVYNATITSIAIIRWSQRVEGGDNPNAFEKFIDQQFPDVRMRNIFPEMEFTDPSKKELNEDIEIAR